ncbi:S-antigen protein [Armadillidium vulgare]|nr:S-antigen protein [Armadillidium vulgare]
MNEKSDKSKKTSPREVLRLLTKELTPEETPYEIRTNVPRPSTIDDSTYELRKHVPESSTTTEDSISSKMIKSRDASNISNNTLSISNFTSLSFGLDDSDEDSLLINRDQNIRHRLRNKRAENPFVKPSESILKAPAPAEKTVDDLGLSVVSLDESIDISYAKREIEKKRKRNRMEVEFLNLTSAVSKLYENVDNKLDENEDSIDLNKEKNPKSRFRKSRKSVHFEISPLINAIPNVSNENDLKLTEKLPILNSKENNDNSISRLSSQELESPENDLNNLELPKSKMGGLESPKSKLRSLESPKSKAGGLESPKSKVGGLESPKSKVGGLESPKSKLRSLESPKSKLRSLESPKSKLRSLESPKSKSRGLESPMKKRRLESPKSKVGGLESPKSKVGGLESQIP